MHVTCDKFVQVAELWLGSLCANHMLCLLLGEGILHPITPWLLSTSRLKSSQSAITNWTPRGGLVNREARCPMSIAACCLVVFALY